jgi:hypothetical protein
MLFIFLCTTLLFATEPEKNIKPEDILKRIEKVCRYTDRGLTSNDPIAFNRGCQKEINAIEHEILMKDYLDADMSALVAGAQQAEVSLQCEANTYDHLHSGIIIKSLNKTGYYSRYATGFFDLGLLAVYMMGGKNLDGIAIGGNIVGGSLIGIGFIASLFDKSEWGKQIKSNHYAAQKFAERTKEHHMHFHKYQHPKK